MAKDVKKILLASVLKPVDEPRMYKKLGATLASLTDTEVHIVGARSRSTPRNQAVRFHPVFGHRRFGWRRIFAGGTILPLLFQLRPKLLIICTHELLWTAIIYKWITGARLVYDIQENYVRNIVYGRRYSAPIKVILSIWIRLRELLATPFIDKFFLAERCYKDELRFTSGKSVVLENKFQNGGHEPLLRRPKTPLRLIYSGTMGESFGTLPAITMASALLALEPGKCVVIGHCPDAKYLRLLQEYASQYPNIELHAHLEPISHDIILSHLAEANLGITSYQLVPSVINKLPTRFFEYAYLRLPFIAPANPLWDSFIQHHHCGIPVDFNNYEAGMVLKAFQSQNFFHGQAKYHNELSWKDEEPRLVQAIAPFL